MVCMESNFHENDKNEENTPNNHKQDLFEQFVRLSALEQFVNLKPSRSHSGLLG